MVFLVQFAAREGHVDAIGRVAVGMALLALGELSVRFAEFDQASESPTRNLKLLSTADREIVVAHVGAFSCAAILFGDFPPWWAVCGLAYGFGKTLPIRSG